MHEPLDPGVEDRSPRITFVYTRKEQQWWVASDRRKAAAQFALSRLLKPGTLEPDPEVCNIIEAESVGRIRGISWDHRSQPCLLAAQSWLDWEWVRLNHTMGELLGQKGVQWWSKVYKTKASIRTIERAKAILRMGSRGLIDVVWQGAMGIAVAQHFCELCPDRRAQDNLISRYDDAESFTTAYSRGMLPLDGMLPIRIDHAVKAAMAESDCSDAKIAEHVMGALNAWILERESIDLIEVEREPRTRKRGRRPRLSDSDRRTSELSGSR